jgi:hypothetical protein
MVELLDILKYVLPALVVMFTSGFLVKRFLVQQNQMHVQNQKQKTSAEMLQVRLQAYERVLLFLERIRPQNLILRNDYSQVDAAVYHRHLIENIRLEFEHNLVQQLYISPKAWEKLVIAKNRVTRIINEAGNKKPDQQTAAELAIGILEMEMADGENTVQSAIDFIKNEVKELF